MNIDTLSIARDLKAAELPAAQAEAIAAAIGHSIGEAAATKADVELSRTELRGEIEKTKSDLRGEIEKTRSDLRGEIEKVRTEIERSRNQLVLWLVGTQIAVAGIMLAALRL